MLKDLGKLGVSRGDTKSDGEPALVSVQEQVQRHREGPTILETSGVGDSQANGAPERVVQSVGEQAHALQHGLQTRLGIKLKRFAPNHCVARRPCRRHALNYEVSPDGRMAYERMKGAHCPHDVSGKGSLQIPERGLGDRRTSWRGYGGVLPWVSIGGQARP